MDKVSVIIPTYNCERFLPQAIDSAYQQRLEWPNTEVIIVNDGSTDNTAKIVFTHYLCRPGISFVHSETNHGTAWALNRGIQKAKGQWIKWLSADDVLLPGAIATLMKNAQEHPDAKNCIFYSEYDRIDENGQIIDTFKEPNYNDLPKEELDKLLADHFIGNGSSSLIHKSIFDKAGGFDESLKVCDDYDFWLRACLVYNVRLWRIPEKILQYRIHAEQLTRKWGETAGPIIQEIRRRYAKH